MSPRAPGVRVKRLARALYVYAALEDFVLLYPVYALLFAETGLSVSEISSLFIVGAVTGMLLEVPSGAWADAVSRRLLLSIGPLLAAAGFALWFLFPSYWMFALGFVLWNAGASLRSGSLEALVYEELVRLDAAERYATIMGRVRAVGLVSVAAATAAAAPVLAFGGYFALGTASVLTCLLCALAGTALPETRGEAGAAVPASPEGAVSSLPEQPEQPEQSEERSERSVAPRAAEASDSPPEEASGRYVAVLRAGLAEVRDNRPVRGALLLVSVVTAIWGGLEEYVPLLAAATGVSETAVPMLVLVVWGGVAAGGLLAGVAGRLPVRTFAVLLAVASLAMAAGALTRQPVGLVLVGAGFCVFQLSSVIADARLQQTITGPSRATVTSLAGIGMDGGTVLVYGVYAAVSSFTGHGVVFALFAVPYLCVALAMAYGGRGGAAPTR
ncbi:MFS transporter [Streptosporangium carneum]|uniref:MFS transporter n=2 Tax=Streptosporangium carneum TaxID=47481 RepID=A0A9W6HZY2_9ACTN|nr:MFS transporter [Streptosporangium carneum]